MSRFGSAQLIAPFFILMGLCLGEAKALTFNGVAAGDMTRSSVILWTRVDNNGAETGLTAQIATDASFNHIVQVKSGRTSKANNYTWKMAVRGLEANRRYYYRFLDSTSSSPTGSFYTLPDPKTLVPFKIGFSGDADAGFRPYPAMANFGSAQNPGSTDLNGFIFLGDTIYETNVPGLQGFSSSNAPKATDSATDIAADMPILFNRYLANLCVTNLDGTPNCLERGGLSSMLSSTGIYTLLDNHEIFGALQSGGAPIAALKENFNAAFAVNTSGTFNNDTIAFHGETKAFYNMLPTAVNIEGTVTKDAVNSGLKVSNLMTPGQPTIRNPKDPRSHNKPMNFFVRNWGRAASYIQLDDRTFRDARMLAPARYAPMPQSITEQEAIVDPQTGKLPDFQLNDLGDAAPGVYMLANSERKRTMLGETQLQWLKAQLLAAKASGSVWIVISVSTPIDQRGSLTDSKSWSGGYPVQRNEILKFIADQKLRNVIFLTADDHNSRIVPLQYQPDPVNSPEKWARLPGVFQILAGPMGAKGPHAITDHSFQNIERLATETNADLLLWQQPGLGLSDYPGVSEVWRNKDGVLVEETQPTPVDFYAPDQFGYTTLAWDLYGHLKIEFWGLNSYAQNLYPSGASEIQKILSFKVKPMQSPLEVSLMPARISTDRGAWINIKGGSGKGAFSYQVSSNGSVSCGIKKVGSKAFLTASGGVGVCSVLVTKAGDSTYPTPESAPTVSIRVN